ncbi:MAG: glycosyltransferase family 2 protein [Planctomycetes bacterium]|nr:glycosyltransferase family 2 protein [Planctomycetota bacterium]
MSLTTTHKNRPVVRRQSRRITNLVSVVVPAYNAAGCLGRCIEAIQRQSYQPIEIIVVNDGSTDATEEVATGFGDRIQYISQQNRGETAARNRGFEQARGEFVTFIDHDDFWEPAFVEKTIEFLKNHPKAIAVSTGHIHRSALSRSAHIQPAFLDDQSDGNNAGDIEPFVIERFFKFWSEHNHVCAGSSMLRGSLLDEAGGQREDLVLSGDMEYWAYLATFGKWGFIPEVLLNIDGTQVPRGNLYSKFYDRYQRCATVENWESRIRPRLNQNDLDGYLRVRGRVATGYTFAHVFVGKDREARQTARQYKAHLEGRYGRLWKLGLSAGWLSWKVVCLATRARIRTQYYLAEKRRRITP